MALDGQGLQMALDGPTLPENSQRLRDEMSMVRAPAFAAPASRHVYASRAACKCGQPKP